MKKNTIKLKWILVVSASIMLGITMNVLAQESCNNATACFQIVKRGHCVRNLNSNQAVSGTSCNDPNNTPCFTPLGSKCGVVWRFIFPSTKPCGQPNANESC